MASERELDRAIKLLSKRTLNATKPGHRTHIDSLLNRVAKKEALKGQCGVCRHLRLEFYGDKLKRMSSVRLHCVKGHTPHLLYQDAPFDIKNCPDYKGKK